MSEQKTEGREGFTLALALVDALPVLFFGTSCILIGLLFRSGLFIVGAALTFLGGLGKVLWKVFLGTVKRDVAFLNKQFRYTMGLGFLLILLSLVLGFRRISLSAILAAVTGIPQLIFFICGICGMITMGILASKLDSSKAKSNWIEQCVNTFAQGCILIGILCIL